MNQQGEQRMKILRSVVAFVLGFLIIGLTGVLTFQLFGDAMLRSANWSVGLRPPSSYVWLMLTTDLLASLACGGMMAIVARKFAYQTGLLLALFLGSLRAYQYFSALSLHPHWYSLVLVFVPLVGILGGVRILRRFHPDIDYLWDL